MPTPTCTHIFADDHRCGSPAMRSEIFCYYHHPTRRPAASSHARRPVHITTPDNHETFHQAIAEVIHHLAANRLDVHRAGLILYSLQLAGRHLP